MTKLVNHNKCSCNHHKTGPKKQDCFIKDEICGNFTINCGCKDDVWTSPSFPVSGSITVFYESGCAGTLLVNIFSGINKIDTLMIPLACEGKNGNSKSITLKNFNRLEICCLGSCHDKCKACIGRFCLNINYRCM
ncbi:S-Ena type endospore appendage [Cytobacillus sp. IB215316]|uniref:S-Ena type endospore appendage n=1 Tax=Cytobacillus sp. IB215316 TaxID=3097354 RepID=UPI002A101419|nr:S-Ena type endospore appendage [Cytobacillus sp. IB215316]MDX8360493.1 S-Ena type endospore appendage [Cytobacillus sp. IB215316]